VKLEIEIKQELKKLFKGRCSLVQARCYRYSGEIVLCHILKAMWRIAQNVEGNLTGLLNDRPVKLRLRHAFCLMCWLAPLVTFGKLDVWIEAIKKTFTLKFRF
jgi:hypothetical protein